jgi:hypothetical protein
MSKGYAQDEGMEKYYIVTRPTKLSDLQLEDLDGSVSHAVKRGRRLRERREAHIKNQLM